MPGVDDTMDAVRLKNNVNICRIAASLSDLNMTDLFPSYLRTPGRLMAALALIAALLPAPPAAAQINTEDVIEDDASGFGGEFGLDLVLRSGNTDLWLLGTSVKLQYATPRAGDVPDAADEDPPDVAIEARVVDEEAWEPRTMYALVTNYERGESEGNTISEHGFVFANRIRMMSQRLGWHLFAQHQFDDFILLDQRSLLGAGIRLVRRPTPWATIQFGTGYMLEYEDLSLPDDTPVDSTHYNHRMANFMVAEASLIEDRLNLVNTLYLQPRIDELDDYRVLDEAEIQVMITESVSLGLSGTFRYDSHPPPGIDSTDVGLVNRLRVQF